MTERFVPTVQGTRVAQQNTRYPATAEQRVDEFGWQLYGHYQDIGMHKTDPPRASTLMLRNLLRSASAPILHAVEVELGDQVASWSGQTLPDKVGGVRFDRSLKVEMAHTPAEQLFLRTAGALCYSAGVRVLSQVNEEDHPLHPTYRAFCKYEYEATFAEMPRRIGTARTRPRERLLEKIIAASQTTLNVMRPFAAHELQCGTKREDLAAELSAKAAPLSWAASTKVAMFERYFLPARADSRPPSACPFAPDAAKVPEEMWNVASLRHGPWPVPGLCPDNIPLPMANGVWATGAELRLLSLAPVAAETLWAGEANAAVMSSSAVNDNHRHSI